jgi:hypothetical protein
MALRKTDQFQSYDPAWILRILCATRTPDSDGVVPNNPKAAPILKELFNEF